MNIKTMKVAQTVAVMGAGMLVLAGCTTPKDSVEPVTPGDDIVMVDEDGNPIPPEGAVEWSTGKGTPEIVPGATAVDTGSDTFASLKAYEEGDLVDGMIEGPEGSTISPPRTIAIPLGDDVDAADVVKDAVKNIEDGGLFSQSEDSPISEGGTESYYFISNNVPYDLTVVVVQYVDSADWKKMKNGVASDNGGIVYQVTSGSF